MAFAHEETEEVPTLLSEGLGEMIKGATVGYYEIRRAVKHEHQKKTWWMRIGSATLLDTGTIMARIEAIPLNWDGSFHLFPSKENEESE